MACLGVLLQFPVNLYQARHPHHNLRDGNGDISIGKRQHRRIKDCTIAQWEEIQSESCSRAQTIIFGLRHGLAIRSASIYSNPGYYTDKLCVMREMRRSTSQGKIRRRAVSQLDEPDCGKELYTPKCGDVRPAWVFFQTDMSRPTSTSKREVDR
ncbi:hypothetical protein BDZ91DRAFT_768001 [Kalaharituber pfeilii]|nr:hypothetical protein BDZ91DRAFT_768001 [Kalaharituber pfeilii]